jgi:hypothetical protein
MLGRFADRLGIDRLPHVTLRLKTVAPRSSEPRA